MAQPVVSFSWIFQWCHMLGLPRSRRHLPDKSVMVRFLWLESGCSNHLAMYLFKGVPYYEFYNTGETITAEPLNFGQYNWKRQVIYRIGNLESHNNIKSTYQKEERKCHGLRIVNSSSCSIFNKLGAIKLSFVLIKATFFIWSKIKDFKHLLITLLH